MVVPHPSHNHHQDLHRSPHPNQRNLLQKTDHLRISYNNGTFTLQFKQEEKGKTLTFSAPTLPALINDKKLWKALKLKHPIMRQRFSDIFTYTQDMPGYQGTDFCQTPMPDDNDDDSDE